MIIKSTVNAFLMDISSFKVLPLFAAYVTKDKTIFLAGLPEVSSVWQWGLGTLSNFGERATAGRIPHTIKQTLHAPLHRFLGIRTSRRLVLPTLKPTCPYVLW